MGLRARWRTTSADRSLGSRSATSATTGLPARLRAERERDHVLLVAEGGAPVSWRDFCVRQGDAVVHAASGEPPARVPVGASRIAVVLNARDEVRTWARALGGDVEVVTAGSDGTARLARRYTGASNGLVLSGGGARACARRSPRGAEAHGVTVALDRVAAAGTGALIAAMVASGWKAAEVDARCYEEFVRRNPFAGYRLRRTSLIGTERISTMLERLFGDMWIEELPLQFFGQLPGLHTRIADLAEHGQCPLDLPHFVRVPRRRCQSVGPGYAPVSSDRPRGRTRPWGGWSRRCRSACPGWPRRPA